MTDIQPVFRLRCAACGYDMPDDAVVEAYALHFSVEHDTDKVHLNLEVICTCGATMRFLHTRQTAAGFADRFGCPADRNRTTVHRGPGA